MLSVNKQQNESKWPRRSGRGHLLSFCCLFTLVRINMQTHLRVGPFEELRHLGPSE